MKTTSAPHQSGSTAPPGAADVACRLDAILGALLLVVAAQFRVLADLTVPVWNRISRSRQRLARLLARIAAGTFLPPRVRAPRIRAAGHPIGDPRRPPPAHLPRGKLWLVARIGYQAAGHGSQLQHLLDDPATRATLDAAPPHALAAVARVLRPLCRTLGVTLPPQLAPPQLTPPQRPPNPRPRAARPPRPKLPPLLPLLPQRRPRDMPFLRFPPKKFSAA